MQSAAGWASDESLAEAGTDQTTRRRFWIALAAVFLLSLVWFLYVWWLYPVRPWGAYKGYFGFYDQSQYLAIARDLASGHLPSRDGYVYGLAYPLLAAPFLKLGLQVEPFVVPNAVAYAATMTMVAVIGARLRSLPFGIICAAALALASPLTDLAIVPWSSTVTLVAVTAVLLVVTSRGMGWPSALVIGIAVGACFAARYVDAAFPAMIGYAGLFWNRVGRPRLVAVATLSAAVIIGLVLLTHWLILGSPLTTPYASHLAPGNTGPSDQDLRSFDLLKVVGRAVGAFITARQGFQRVPGQPLGELFPWAIAAPFGVWALLRERHPLRWMFAVAFAASVIGTIFYLSFRASGAGGLQFGFLHYFKVWFPIWGILAAYGIARLLDRLNGAGAARASAIRT